MAVLSSSQLNPVSTAPFAAPDPLGTIPQNTAEAIFGRQSQADLDTCIEYCNRRWPGDASCLLACRDSAAASPKGVSDSGDFFAGALAEASSTQNDITDLYNAVSVPDWAQNTGINPSGTLPNTPVVISPASVQTTQSDSTSMWLVAGGAALLGLACWLLLRK